MGQLVSSLTFNRFHLLVRPGGDHLLVPTWLSLAAAHSDGQGWPKAIAKRLALDGYEHGGRLRWSGELSCSECKQRQFRGELAIRREDRAHPCIRSIREDRNHDAVMRIAAKLRSSGPILHRGLKAMEERRVTATSDRHRQPRWYGPPMWLSCCCSYVPAIAHAAGRKMTPSGTSPVMTRRHSAMRSLRASATIIVLRVLPRPSVVRASNHFAKALCFWNLIKHQAN
jgi:hypothetical protein